MIESGTRTGRGFEGATPDALGPAATTSVLARAAESDVDPVAPLNGGAVVAPLVERPCPPTGVPIIPAAPCGVVAASVSCTLAVE
jgi:hypothetical protein